MELTKRDLETYNLINAENFEIYVDHTMYGKQVVTYYDIPNKLHFLKYYKIGKHGKITELDKFDLSFINKFPDDTVFYDIYPEEGIALCI